MKNSSFTLIEILVVATIIALLTSIGVVSYTQFSKQSRDAKRKADLEQIRAAVEMYRSNDSTNSYPPYNVVTAGCVTSDINGDCGGSVYLQIVPKDPKNSSYTYYFNSSTSDYTLGAYLENSSASACAGGVSCTVANCNYCLGPYGQKN